MMGPRGILEQEARKPIKVGATLARLGKYFGSYAFVLFLVAGLIVATTWAQVAAPELIGQATDCFISPAIAQTAADTAFSTIFGGVRGAVPLIQIEAIPNAAGQLVVPQHVAQALSTDGQALPT